MINNLSGINYNSIYAQKAVKTKANTAINKAEINMSKPQNISSAAKPAINNSSVSFGAYRVVRTNMSSEEQKIYSKIVKALPHAQRGQMDYLLKTGILLDSRSNDNSTVLDNLNKIIEEKRAPGLDKNIVLSEVVNTITNPFVINQKFGDIPDSNLIDIVNNPQNYKPRENSAVEKYDVNIKNVHSAACVAASIEFDLASKQPAEFVRIANGLTSEKISAVKKLKMSDIAPSWTEATWFLNEFHSDYKRTGWDNVEVNMHPDRNAIIRARIQLTNKDPNERSLIDVLMQSTFMEIGSQQTYNSLTDTRTGKYNSDNTGLTDIEKSFAETIATGKNKCSVTYQIMDENGFITGYECPLDKMKKHIVDSLNHGENVIVGYTQQDETKKVVNGHEITIVKLEKDEDGREIFVCNDTDDESDKPVRYYVEDLLPAIHHAGLSKYVVENDEIFKQPKYEAIDYYKSLLENKNADEKVKA